MKVFRISNFIAQVRNGAALDWSARRLFHEQGFSNRSVHNMCLLLSESTQSRHSHFALGAFKVHLTSCLRMSD